MGELFDEEACVRLWLRVESSLAAAQAKTGLISEAAAEDIRAAVGRLEKEPPDIWDAAANVGYPILPLLRAIDAGTTGEGTGRVHLGATTQDIMDTALALQLRDGTDLLLARLDRLGDAIAELATRHGSTVMAGRTHAQQAVPITFGMKLGVVLEQVRRVRDRLARERAEVAVVSLHGAAGTSAALGAGSDEVRRHLADILELGTPHVPWHVARDSIFAQGANAVAAAEIAARWAREVIDLSRTEIGEVAEPVEQHRGASSTMPQKANPILSEAIIGFAVSANALLPALGRAVEAGHERSAGEWQVEWHVVPQIFVLASSALLRATELSEQLVVNEDAMALNLQADHGLLMAEAYMIALADVVGRERAHDIVYEASLRSRREHRPLLETIAEGLPASHRSALAAVAPADYTGSSAAIAESAVAGWRARGPRPERNASK
jgi:3-carboxy-cis,cis-muconate cycloisomerase